MTKGKYEKTAQRIKELVEMKCGGSPVLSFNTGRDIILVAGFQFYHIIGVFIDLLHLLS